jgi:hypothetical protein
MLNFKEISWSNRGTTLFFFVVKTEAVNCFEIFETINHIIWHHSHFTMKMEAVHCSEIFAIIHHIIWHQSFYPEDGGNTLFRNTRNYQSYNKMEALARFLPNFTPFHVERHQSRNLPSCILPSEGNDALTATRMSGLLEERACLRWAGSPR